MDHIEQMVLTHPELADAYSKLGSLFEKKLWHQLTVAVAEFVNNDAHRRGDNFIRLYSNFISKFENKLNQLELAKIAAMVVRSHADAGAAMTFVNAQLDKTLRLGPAATLFLEITKIGIQLRTPVSSAASDLENVEAKLAIKAALERKKVEVDGLSGLMDTCVHSAYYELASEFYKEAGPPEAYYKHAIMLLAYTPFDAMPKDKATALATDMSLAALSGDGLYNFGEVLATPIVGALAGTPNAWLADMLAIFNRGDIEAFGALYAANKAAFEAQPALGARLDFVKEKLTLLALMNLVFATPAHDRTLAFASVASHVRLPVDQVEWLAMRAMSLGLIKGSLDEVSQTVTVDWVQPRVLDADQMGSLAERLGSWAAKVDETRTFIEGNTMELGI